MVFFPSWAAKAYKTVGHHRKLECSLIRYNSASHRLLLTRRYSTASLWSGYRRGWREAPMCSTESRSPETWWHGTVNADQTRPWIDAWFCSKCPPIDRLISGHAYLAEIAASFQQCANRFFDSVGVDESKCKRLLPAMSSMWYSVIEYRASHCICGEGFGGKIRKHIANIRFLVSLIYS